LSDTSVTGGPGQPSTGQPNAGQPSAGQPSAGQPDPGQPAAGQSLAGPTCSAAARPARPARPARHRRRRQPAALAWPLGIAFTALALFACYLRQSQTVAVGSDGASQALQAWDLLHGHLLLPGWWMTDVSFYTTELPQYALIEAAHGLRASDIHLAGAMTYTLLVLTAALLARGRATGREGLIRAALTAALMLAPQLGPGTQTLVLSPDHTGTCVPVLLLFLLIDRAHVKREGTRGRAREALRASHRGVVPPGEGRATCLALAWIAVADPMTVFIAILPLALVCVTRLLAPRAVGPEGLPPDNGTPPPSPVTAARRYEAALAIAAVLAVPLELTATVLIKAAGGWQAAGLRTGLAAAGQLAGNARLTGAGLLELFGANVFAAANAPQAALAAVHLAGLALAVAGALLAGRRFFHGPLIESVLLAGLVIDLAAYLAGVQAVDILSTREIAPVLPFGAVLAGRLVGPRLLAACQVRPQIDTARDGATPQARLTSARYALGTVLALYLAGLGYAAAQPPAAAQDASLAAWLRAHHLTVGLSGYHQASIVTLESGGAVTLRPVRAVAGRLAPYAWNANSAWFGPAAASPTFLVLTRPGAPGSAGLTVPDAVAAFGPPASSYADGPFVILVWPHGNLLAALR
jgi:hypothetical protein